MEYITISAFAERVGVTPQSVYKRVKTDLAPYTKEENGVKLIGLDALELYKDKQQVYKPNARIIELEAEAARLRQELEVKQQKINELHEKLELNNEKWLEILDRQTTQHQLLLAQQQTLQQQLLNAPTTQNEVDNSSEDEQPVENQYTNRGLFSRLFKKHN